MLDIRSNKRLAKLLRISRDELSHLIGHADDYYELLTLFDPARPKKPRDVVNVTGPMRRVQRALYRNVLIRRLRPSPYSHGCVPGKSIKSNAEVHRANDFVFKADISNFYPSISQDRVYKMFRQRFECMPPVAKSCTRLCTYNHCLSLGLVTSPILADQLIRPLDDRIGKLCEDADLSYTRFVDDITISGPYNLEKSGIPRNINAILLQNGFSANEEKFEFGRNAGSIAITGVRRTRRGNLDVRREYADEVGRQLDDCANLAAGRNHDWDRPYFTRAQIFGRIQFVIWVNRRRGSALLARYRRTNWRAVDAEAQRQGLVARKKVLIKRDNADSRPAPVLAPTFA